MSDFCHWNNIFHTFSVIKLHGDHVEYFECLFYFSKMKGNG
jgi:hypothetical protein